MDRHSTSTTEHHLSYGHSEPEPSIGTHEHLLTLADATKVLPTINGKRHSGLTLWRWCRKGIRGVRLEYIRVGRTMMTSQEALDRFYRALAQSDPILNYTNQRLRGPRRRHGHPHRRRQIDAAKQRLKEAGF